ncbi:4-hydroxy-tetrahydrodipicolinate reductase [Sedimentibacter hydroxybenzoicus DSM 7310]|uniref:4-hydroxy-tetrahydrodipicolinate reductase n=1 Tax=Sedimentibacter hydroxybenzoicus DSM 7310 TaxID=1123245 RepID=A0A974GXY4_SEDHY|nr:4-hydroxy-tetrahydrodipicolinate reductase [Sedimentibacter hydroxybenzoicus DSM 7310]
MNVALCGYGAMGKVVEQEIKTYDNVKLTGIISPKDRKKCENVHDIDIIIDFSNPANLDFLLNYAKERNAALLICTTGFNQEQKNKIVEAGKNIPVLLSSNTSTGINIVRKMLKLISNDLNNFEIDIVDRHHNKKVDAPSGTAKTLAEDIMQETGREKIEMHSLRAGTIPGEHTVIFSGIDEIIEIKHTAFSKKIFARGAIDIALKLVNQKEGFYTTEELFDMDNRKTNKIVNIA